MEEEEYINELRKEISEKTHMGDSSKWKLSHFERLNSEIYEKTAFNISVSTLKRFYGKGGGKVNPSLTTLNALSIFTGYKDWFEYKNKVDHLNVKTKNSKKNKQKILLYLTALFLLFFLTILSISLYRSYRANNFDKEQIKFVIPQNRYVFQQNFAINYDLKSIPEKYRKSAHILFESFIFNDSIDLTEKGRWERNKIIVKLPAPSKYHAQLYVNGLLIKEKTIYMESDNWMGNLYENDSIENFKQKYLFISNDSVINNEKLYMPLNVFYSLKKDPYKHSFSYFYVNKRLEKINYDNFLFSLKARNKNLVSKSGICRTIYFTLNFDRGYISFNIADKSCLVNTHILFKEKSFLSRYDNYEQLGVNISEWNNVKLESKNKKVYIKINESTPLIIDYYEDLGNLYNISLKGTGAEFDDIHLFNSEGFLIYHEDFNKDSEQ